MLDCENTFNTVSISGRITKEPEFYHGEYDEGFWQTVISCLRDSGTSDNIPVWIPESYSPFNVCQGDLVAITGELRDTNVNGRQFMRIYARHIDKGDSYMPDRNFVCLEGVLNKEPIYRRTPKGREITDLSVIVDRVNGKKDFIPCISWGRNAQFASRLHTGDRVSVKGRVQSREYKKVLDSGMSDTRTTYEVSISQIGIIYRGEENDNNKIRSELP